MRTLSRICSSALALAFLCWSQIGFAQPTCGDIQFSTDISSRFPNARAACIDIVERDGRPYAHFKARIMSVRGGTVEAQFVAPDGTTSRTIAFTPSSDARVRIGGRSYRYNELSRGQELDLYLPPDRWAVAVAREPVDFAAAPAIDPVPLSEPTPQLAALPATASSLPWLPLIGALLITLGGSIAVFATRRG